MLLDGLPQTDQRKLIFSILNLLATKHLTLSGPDTSTEDSPTVWAAAGALRALIGMSETRKADLIAWLTNISGAGIGEACASRRAALAALAHDKEAILAVLEKTLGLFGDQLYVRHSPMLQQEGEYTQIIVFCGARLIGIPWPSPCSGLALERRLPSQAISYQADDPAPVKHLSHDHFKPHSRVSESSQIFGHGGGRGPLGSYTYSREEIGFSHGGDQDGRRPVVQISG